MRSMAWLAVVLLALVPSGDLAADEAGAFEGAYLLVQHDGYQRIVTLEPGGTVSQVSDQQPLLGFTSGHGAWRSTGRDKVQARVIDFSYELEENAPVGPSLIVYDLAFSDLVSGKYQTVTGQFAGAQYATGQNPLNPTEAPVRTFGIPFKGQRITPE